MEIPEGEICIKHLNWKAYIHPTLNQREHGMNWIPTLSKQNKKEWVMDKIINLIEDRPNHESV